jgi:hypothetical protein
MGTINAHMSHPLDSAFGLLVIDGARLDTRFQHPEQKVLLSAN